MSARIVSDVEWEDEGEVSQRTNKKDRDEIPSSDLKRDLCV